MMGLGAHMMSFLLSIRSLGLDELAVVVAGHSFLAIGLAVHGVRFVEQRLWDRVALKEAAP
jgi:hypothetical protein